MTYNLVKYPIYPEAMGHFARIMDRVAQGFDGATYFDGLDGLDMWLADEYFTTEVRMEYYDTEFGQESNSGYMMHWMKLYTVRILKTDTESNDIVSVAILSVGSQSRYDISAYVPAEEVILPKY